MSDATEDTTVVNQLTHRQVQEMKRAAFVESWVAFGSGWCHCGCPEHDRERVEAEAQRRYPIRRKVPRVIQLPGHGGTIESEMSGTCFKVTPNSRESRPVWMDQRDIDAMLDLLANPFEYVEE